MCGHDPTKNLDYSLFTQSLGLIPGRQGQERGVVGLPTADLSDKGLIRNAVSFILEAVKGIFPRTGRVTLPNRWQHQVQLVEWQAVRPVCLVLNSFYFANIKTLALRETLDIQDPAERAIQESYKPLAFAGGMWAT